MEILYLGEISVQNELYDTGDMELYLSACNKIFERLQENPDLDITTLTLRDLEN